MRLTGPLRWPSGPLVLTALYPIWFAQSTLAHADIFATACTMWGLVYSLPARDRKPVIAAAWFTLAVLSKETAVVVPLALMCCALVSAIRTPGPQRKKLLIEAGWISSCVLPLAAWYVWHYAETGFALGVLISCVTTPRKR